MAQNLSNSQVEKAVGAIQYLTSLNVPSDGPASGSQDGSGVSCRESANSQSDHPGLGLTKKVLSYDMTLFVVEAHKL